VDRAKLATNQSLAKLSLADLGKVEVTSVSKEPEEVRRTPAAIYVLTQEDIRRSGATTLPEALRLVPGVEVARVDSDHWAVGVRGFGGALASKLLVLIDGRSVYTPLYAGVYWEAQDTMIEDIDRIEVIRGPGGTIWGANAVNGVINIITKNAKDTHGLLAALGGGTVDQATGAVRYGGGNDKGFDYRIYSKGFTRGPEYHQDLNNFDDWRGGQAGFRSDWDVNSRDSVTVQGDIYKEAVGEAVSVGVYSPPSTAFLIGNGILWGGNLNGRWKRTLSAGSDIQVQAYFDHTSHFEPQFGETRNTFDFDFLHHLTLKGGQNFLWGLGARVSPGDFVQLVPTINFLPDRQTDEIYSGFVQDEIPLAPNRLSLTIGKKLEHNNYTGFEVQPSGRLLWTPTLRTSFWGSITRAVRTPSRLDEDLDLTDFLIANPAIFLRVMGTANFFSEQLIAYEAGVRSLITPHLYVDVAAFRNDYNYLYGYGTAYSLAESSPPPPHLVLVAPVANEEKGTTTGFEIAPDWQATSWWQLKGSLSYIHLNLESKAGNPNAVEVLHVNTVQGSSPHHQEAIQSRLNLPGNFEFDQTYRYVDGLMALSVPGYGTADLHFGWLPSGHVGFGVFGQNLLQPRHVEFTGNPGLPVEIKRDI
jgi:iron complex outermembrane recepter protein